MTDAPAADRWVLRGASLLEPAGWAMRDLAVRDGTIESDGWDAAGRAEVDGSGLRVVPGWIDLQCNGGLGIDLASDPGALWQLGALLPRWGVTAWLPTIVTAPEGTIDEALRALAAGPPAGWVGAVPLGLHLEGPFLAPGRRGAHPAALLREPSTAEAAAWSRAAGVAVVTLAPELPGALELIGELAARDVVVSLGHSEADEETASAAVEAGARWVTHLFNAMEPLRHREPGLVGVALTDERLHVGLIADGVHVAPRAVAVAQHSLGRRLTLVTDAVGALGMPDGPVRLGGAVVEVTGGAVRLVDGTLAGSNLSMDRAVRNLVAMAGCSWEAALFASSGAPAQLLGDAHRGRIAAGARADLVVLDGDDQVVAAIVGGHVAFAVHPARWPAG